MLAAFPESSPMARSLQFGENATEVALENGRRKSFLTCPVTTSQSITPASEPEAIILPSCAKARELHCRRRESLIRRSSLPLANDHRQRFPNPPLKASVSPTGET